MLPQFLEPRKGEAGKSGMKYEFQTGTLGYEENYLCS